MTDREQIETRTAIVDAMQAAIGLWLQPGTWVREDNGEELGAGHWGRIAQVALDAALAQVGEDGDPLLCWRSEWEQLDGDALFGVWEVLDGGVPNAPTPVVFRRRGGTA